MSVKPILFNTEMVRAILEGRKTQTRRVVRGKNGVDILTWPRRFISASNAIQKAPCSPGDILWVRETWGKLTECSVFPPCGPHQERFIYRADVGDPDHFQAKWHPSIHMPKQAARIFLQVKDVRVERLQDITEEQAVLEGCSAGRVVITGGPWGVEDDPDEWTAVEDFQRVWDSTIKPTERFVCGWDTNPWVWVIEFEQCSKPEGWC